MPRMQVFTTGSFRAVQFDPVKQHCVNIGTVPIADVEHGNAYASDAAVAVV